MKTMVRREIPGVLNLRKNHFHLRWSNSFLNIHQQQIFQINNPIGDVLQKLIHHFISRHTRLLRLGKRSNLHIQIIHNIL
ncbi:hypothetical protein [Citrobacter koseri]|uniref:hypothetical protein n=1 Tax=Citrobacter koseri TaxID=545 RepID=UPI000A7C304D|nr:hypothetical protein [Citrobacter koseri]